MCKAAEFPAHVELLREQRYLLTHARGSSELARLANIRVDIQQEAARRWEDGEGSPKKRRGKGRMITLLDGSTKLDTRRSADQTLSEGALIPLRTRLRSKVV